MSLEGVHVLKPAVNFEVIRGPASVRADELAASLLSFEYRDSDRKKAVVTMDVDNSSGKFFNWAILLVGLRLKFSFGYGAYQSPSFAVTLRKVEAPYLPPAKPAAVQSPRPDAYGVVRYEGIAENVKMHLGTSDRGSNPADAKFYGLVNRIKGLPLNQAVRQIALAYGYQPKNIFIEDRYPLTAEPVVGTTFLQLYENRTVEQVLRSLGNELGYDVVKLGSKYFRFHSKSYKASTTESVTYFKGPDLLSFSINGNYNLNVSRVRGKSIDPRKRAPITPLMLGTGQLGGAAVTPLRNKSVGDGAEIADIVEAIHPKVRASAIRRLTGHLLRRWKIAMSIVGNPNVFVGTSLELANFGDIVDGRWYVNEAVHKIDGQGYTTEIGLKGKVAGTGAYDLVPLLSAMGTVIGSGVVIGKRSRTSRQRKKTILRREL